MKHMIKHKTRTYTRKSHTSACVCSMSIVCLSHSVCTRASLTGTPNALKPKPYTLNLKS